MRKLSKTTIHNIAQQLQVSPSTVSRALNDHPRISQQTKEKVWQLAQEMSYRSVFETEKKDNSQLIAMVVPNQESTFMREIIRIVSIQAQARGYLVVVYHTYESFQTENTFVQEIAQLHPAAVLIALASDSPNAQHFEPLKQQGIPMVFFYRVDYQFDAPRVVIDNFNAAFRATLHLVENGYKRIAHLAGPPSCSVYSEITAGYKAALEASDIEFRPEYLVYSHLSNADTRQSLSRLFGPGTQPNAIFAASHNAAIETLLFLKNNNIRVPYQVGVLCYGYHSSSAFVMPSLTIIEQPTNDFANALLDKLWAEIETGYNTFHTGVCAAKLIMRTSTLPL